MVRFALNHMTLAQSSYAHLLDVAARLGCTGVEVRTDLSRSLFDGESPRRAMEMARERGLQLLALAELTVFGPDLSQTLAEAETLLRRAVDADIGAVILIPDKPKWGNAEIERSGRIREVLRELKPLFEACAVNALIEPLGFSGRSLRSKQEAVDAIESIDGAGRFRLVHDTFHHALAGGGPLFPEHTGLVHVSAVLEPGVPVDQLGDASRVLVQPGDRLQSIEQLRALRAGGYRGLISMEAFAPSVHTSVDIERELAASFEYIASSVAAMAA